MSNLNKSKAGTIVPLYFPWLLSVLTQADPVVSFWIAWAGSLFIFYWTLVFQSRYISSDLKIQDQIMRPIFLVQIIFAGFMCSSSVFYFLDHLGYVYFEKAVANFYISNETYYIAKCQRMSLLGHAALVTGMITLIPQYSVVKKYRINTTVNVDTFLIIFALSAYAAGFIVAMIPPIFQFSIGLNNAGIICGAFVMVKGIIEKKVVLTATGGSLFIVNLINSSLSGYKEPIFVNFLIVGCLLFPYYKRLTLFVGIPVIYGLFYILPTYVNTIRSQSWSGGASAEDARSEAFETLFNDGNEGSIDETNWGFLTHRLSEIGMFTRFVESTPDQVDYYGFTIVRQAVEAIIPRIFWPGKPITENVAMERVYRAGVVSEMSKVSAKTRPIVDAYLSGGTIGVFVSLFIYGLIAQGISNKAESLFGGYQLGSLIMFNGCLQPIWRGNNFEFIGNSIFWSFILLLMIFRALKIYEVLVPVPKKENLINQKLL